MGRRYTSPIRVADVYLEGRRHVFPQSDGGTKQCYPPHCRECWREKHWKKGQTHGSL